MAKNFNMMELNNIYHGDCLEVMRKMPDGFIDLIVTSPPYNVGIEYDKAVNDSMEPEKYIQFTKDYLSEFFRVTKSDGRVCLNIGYTASTTNGGIDYLTLLNIAREIGFNVRETIVWVKTRDPENPQNFSSSSGSSTAWGSWMSASSPICRARSEFIFVLEKEETAKRSGSKISDMTKEEFFEYTTSVWYFPAETDRTHAAPFPAELPKRCIKLYSFVEDIVMDPFSGSGTTCHAAKVFNRKYIGIELSKKYHQLSLNRVNTLL